MRRSPFWKTMADRDSPVPTLNINLEHTKHIPTHYWPMTNTHHAMKWCVTWLAWSRNWSGKQVHWVHCKSVDMILHVALQSIIVLNLWLTITSDKPLQWPLKPPNWVGHIQWEVMVDWVPWKEIWGVKWLTFIVPNPFQQDHSRTAISAVNTRVDHWWSPP